MIKQYKVMESPIPIKGIEDLYTVTSDGTFFNNKTKRVLKQNYNKQGYKVLYICRRTRNIQGCFLVARLVAKAFVPNEHNKPQVDHIDNNKLNNHYKNLQWLTGSENVKKAFIQGRKSPVGNSKRFGENHPNSRFKNEDILDIRMFWKNGIRQVDIARVYGVSNTHINSIIKKRVYASV